MKGNNKQKHFAALCLLVLVLVLVLSVFSATALAHTEDDPHCVDLVMGHDEQVVGDVCVWDDGTNLYVRFTTDPGYALLDAHVCVADSDFPWTSPGSCPYKKDFRLPYPTSNAKIECEAGNFDAATKKLGVAKNQVESFASMVKITRRISEEDKASFLADAAEIKRKIQVLIEYIETENGY